jgi:hypothetical protein
MDLYKRSIPALIFWILASTIASRVQAAENPHVDCTVPPYGDTVTAYRDYVDRTMALVLRIGEDFGPSHILPGICEAKFHDKNRLIYYNLGFLPKDFANKSVTQLGIDWIIALKNFADKMPSEQIR